MFLAVVPARVLAAFEVEQPTRTLESVEEMLQSFVADFRSDPFASRPITFGIRVQDAERPDWHVFVGGREAGEGFLFMFGEGA